MHEYYALRVGQMLETFEHNVSGFRPVLGQRFGSEAPRIVGNAREAFRRLLEELPFIGGSDNPLTSALVSCTEILALFRALQLRGISAREFGRLAVDTTAAGVESAPSSSESQQQSFARFCADRRRGALDSQLRRYPGDWVYTTRDGDGGTFDFAVDYTECGIVKWFRQQGADALTPFMCQMDYAISRSMDSGLVRTMTLAAGDPVCDFSFKRGRPVTQTSRRE
jgi:hypothetical protein